MWLRCTEQGSEAARCRAARNRDSKEHTDTWVNAMYFLSLDKNRTLPYNRTMKRWSDEDIRFLIDNYPNRGAVYVAEYLGRTRQSVNAKAMKLGVVVRDDVKLNIALSKGSENLNHSPGELNNNWKGGAELYDRMAYKRRTKEKYSDRDKARGIVRSAIRKGILVRLPCVVCGDIKSEAHHDDYSKPLDVVFLCRKHHVIADKIRKDQ